MSWSEIKQLVYAAHLWSNRRFEVQVKVRGMKAYSHTPLSWNYGGTIDYVTLRLAPSPIFGRGLGTRLPYDYGYDSIIYGGTGCGYWSIFPTAGTERLLSLRL